MPDPFAWNTEQGLHPEALDPNNTCKRKKRLIECNRYSTYEDGTGRLSAYVIIVLIVIIGALRLRRGAFFVLLYFEPRGRSQWLIF